MGAQPTNKTIPLNTGYKDRLTVKAAGAKWLPDSKIWTTIAQAVYKNPDFWLTHVDFSRLYNEAVESMKLPTPPVGVARSVAALEAAGGPPADNPAARAE